MLKFVLRASAYTFVALLAGLPAYASPELYGDVTGTWQDTLDRATSGAAASVMLHRMCEDPSSAARAVTRAAQQLSTTAKTLSSKFGAPAPEVWAYAHEAYSIKIKALWVANEGVSCEGLGRLRDIASATGFALP